MGSHPGPSRGLGTGLRATLLVALAAASLVRFLGVGTFRYSDASRHAMDGVFVLDVLRHLPQALRSPWEYAADYYAHYPALGFFFYYPPLFAVVEAVFFKLFGVSAATARLAVAATFSLGIGVWFWFLRRLMGDFYAFCACLLLLGIPQTVHTGRLCTLARRLARTTSVFSSSARSSSPRFFMNRETSSSTRSTPLYPSSRIVSTRCVRMSSDSAAIWGRTFRYSV